MKTIVAFYSHTGNTRTVGKGIAKLMKADVEDITDVSEPIGFSTSLAAQKMKEALHTKYQKGEKPFKTSDFFIMAPYFIKLIKTALKLGSPISPIAHDPSQYDLVIVGTPIWTHALLPPVRTYLYQNKSKLKKVAFYCTMGGSGGKPAFTDMKAITKKEPLATLEVTEEEIGKGKQTTKVKKFAQALKG